MSNQVGTTPFCSELHGMDQLTTVYDGLAAVNPNELQLTIYAV